MKKSIKTATIVTAFLLLPVVVLAQVALPAETGTFLDQVIKFLNDIPATVIMSLMAAIEFVLRLVPTSAPMSVLVPVKKVMDALVFIIVYVSGLLEKLIVVANKVK